MDKFDEKIIGYEATKNILRQILDTLKRPELYKSKGASIPRGLLMESDPGLGKSLLATVFIKESGRKSLVFRKTSQENSFLDELRAAFLAAKEAAPSILLLEDLNLYYFYLMGVITDHSTREAFHKKNDPYPTIYRLDRIHSIKETGEKFSVPYKDRFKEGEYKNRTQFMFGGEPQKISFNYYGPSVEAVLDKFPMAKVVDEKEGVCSIEAEVFGTGVKMWLLSQGSKVKVTAPETLVQEIKQEIERVDAQYEQMGGKTNG